MKNTLKDIIKINNKYCRSVNLNLDFNDIEILKSLICPTSFKLVFESMIDNIYTTGQTAFTWTGPYGAGKSSLALLLIALMGKSRKHRDIAQNIIGSTLTKKLYSKISINKGWKVLPVVGDLTNIEKLICNAIKEDRGKQIDDIFDIFTDYIKRNEGLLLIIDEMGKLLETAANDSSDIYFYQKLAEFASRTNGKFVVIGILHQSFADYARHLPFTIRDEWIKVQGRYVDMPINTVGEEQIELISRAIKCLEYDKRLIRSIAKKTVEIIAKNKKIVSEKSLVEKLTNCWPICPVVIILLCQLSRKKFGQNQRSIFSFLSSGEPIALRDFINNNEYFDKILYMPTDLFDYIKINLESTILSSTDSKLWHTAIEAISKCQARGFSELHINILKTIAVIDLFSVGSGVVSNIELLKSLYYEKDIDIETIIEDLKNISVIIFKKHIDAYSIYEGSDFDIENALDEAYNNINKSNIDKLIEISNFKPVIAKRYYHKYGCLRWFDIILAPIDECNYFLKREMQKSKAVGMIVILLPTTLEEEDDAKHIIKNYGNLDFPVFFTIAESTRIINEYLKDLIALEWIQNNRNELAGDSIARREVEDRKNVLNSYLDSQLSKILVESKWYIDGEERKLKINELSILVSEKCENLFCKSPIIKSELINREKPSGNANAALYALLKAMIIYRNEVNLGIEGFTPVRGLYNILLKETDIHRMNNKGVYIYGEPKNNNLKHLWEFNDKYLCNSNTISILELYEKWRNEPFGIKTGLLSFLMLAYILTRDNVIAVYRDNIYNAEINDFLVEHIYLNPKSISIKYIKTDNINNNIITALINVINDIGNEELDNQSEPLQVAQKLVAIVDNLHPWVLKTKLLSKETTQFRELIKSSNDPNKLIFDDLSKILNLNNLYERLSDCLKELIDFYPSMIKSVGSLLTSELDIPLATPEQIEKMKERAKNIRGVAGDFQLDAFAARLSTFSASYSDIAGIISLANNKPQKDWIDLDIENAKKEILRLCTEFKKAELYTKLKNRPATRQAIAYLCKIGGKEEIITGEFDLLIDKQNEVDVLLKKIKQAIKNEVNVSVVLTALAETSIEYLREKNEK
jgi:ABC-type molybdenum transport system ATPase subunit/photorepair protein PhrA